MSLRDTLAATPAADQLIVIEADLDRRRILVRPMIAIAWVPIVLLVFFGTIMVVLLGSKLLAGISKLEVVAFAFIALVLAGLLGPMVYRRMSGAATWRREVDIRNHGVHVADTMSGVTDEWDAALDDFKGLSLRVVTHTSVASAGGAAQTSRFDVVELVHEHAGQTIPLYKRKQARTGGMDMLGLLAMARQRGQGGVGGNRGAQTDPALQQFANRAAALLGVPLLGALDQSTRPSD